MPQTHLEVEHTLKKEAAIIRLDGALTTETRSLLESHVEEIRAYQGLREVLLNLNHLSHIDSRGLAALLAYHRYFLEHDIGFRLVNVPDNILRLFQVSNLVNLFEIGPPPENEASLVHNRRDALWQSHAFTTQLLAALGEAVLGLDAEGRVLFANPAAERLLGWDEADLLGRALGEAIVPRDSSGAVIPLGSGAQGPPTQNALVRRLEASLVTREGEVLEVEMVITTIFQAGQNIGKVIGLRDVSGRKQAQEELKRLATAVDQAAEIIVITDPSGVIQYVNPAFEKITGYTREEAVGQNTRILKSGLQDDKFYQEMWNDLVSGKVWVGRFTNRHKDGRLYEEDATISPVHDSMGNLINFVAVKKDVTQEVAMEKQLRDSQKFEAIAQLAAGVAHDFNNLLTSIIGNIQLARTRPKGNISSYMEKAEQACMRGASLVQQLLLYSRRSAAEKEVLNLNAIVREVIALARETIDRRIEIVTHLNPHIPLILADPGQMHQVLLNLVVNARDAIQENLQHGKPSADHEGTTEPLLRITIETGFLELEATTEGPDLLHSPGEYARLTVSDTGVGMDAHTLEHLFEPFFTTKDVGRGTGLGLATVYGIVRDNGGWIDVSSEVGEGSSFSIQLPAQARSAAVTLRDVNSPVLQGGPETILVVDDEDDICEIARETLEEFGYRVLIARDGSEALEIFEVESAAINLILLDLSMPRLSGREVIRRLREKGAGVRIIVSSGYMTNDLKLKDLGCRFIQKPFQVDYLVQLVRETLDNPPGWATISD